MAVAPIIATLLMIAITVIGGVMIYVFTQGFFGNNITASPFMDAITMSGYDMQEVISTGPACPGPSTTGVRTHEGQITCHGDIALDNLKTSNEEGTIFIRNIGQKPYTITKLEVNGEQMDFVSTDLAIAAGKYGIYTVPNAATKTADTTLRNVATILPGEEGTLLVSFDAGNTAADGRTIPLKITSATGSVYNFNVVIGAKN